MTFCVFLGVPFCVFSVFWGSTSFASLLELRASLLASFWVAEGIILEARGGKLRKTGQRVLTAQA